MSDHARLSPSAATRWLTCPGSVKLIESLPPSVRYGQSSPAAERGTAIHELSERALNDEVTADYFMGKLFNGFMVDKEMCDIAQIYIDYVSNLQGTKWFEQKVTLEPDVPECWGTADAIVLDEDKLEVIDLKTGRWSVDPKENRQLMIYALGALLKLESKGHTPQEVALTIVQPIPGQTSVKTWWTTRDELMEFKKTVQKSVITIAVGKPKYVMSDEGCKWCPAKSICPAQQDAAAEAAATDFSDFVESEKTLAYWLDLVPHLRSFCDAVEDHAHELLSDGETVPGFRLSKPQVRRSWSDVDAVKEYVITAGLEEDFFFTGVLSPAQIEKAGIDLEEVQDFIEAKETKSRVIRAKKN